jgi:hypothetical protein
VGHEAPRVMVVNIKGENHKHCKCSVERVMGDVKVQTGQRLLHNQCLLSTNK